MPVEDEDARHVAGGNAVREAMGARLHHEGHATTVHAEKDQRRNGRREHRSQIRDRDGFILIVTMHMYTLYRRID
jgi:hypothetical protein